MRIACDLDGVLADLHGPFVRTALRLYPDLDVRGMARAEIATVPSTDDEAAEPSDADHARAASSLALTRRQSEVVWRDIAGTEDFWEGLQEIEAGAIARLAALADERRWEVIFVTSRPKTSGRTVQRQSQRWLTRHGFPDPSTYVVHGSRGRIAAALHLDVVIDDRPDNCLDVVLESKAGAILVWRGGAQSVPTSAKRLGIAVVPTVDECLNALVTADESGDGGGLLDRLRRMFGLKTKSPSPLIR